MTASSERIFDKDFHSHLGVVMDILTEILGSLNDQANPQYNLGTYTTTLMDKDANSLINSFLPYNKVNRNEYPEIRKMEEACIKFLMKMIHLSETSDSFGLSTMGSSEAILMACYSLKNGHSGTERKNIIVSDCAHSSWISAARLLDIEIREISLEVRCIEKELLTVIDKNTIGIGLTLGTTSTGAFEPIEEIDNILSTYQINNKQHVPIHVDAASGGFIAPFQFPELKWDFRLKNVQSINISGHKYGMVYPSIGWVFWKKRDVISPKMKINIEYLKDKFSHFGVNFSAPSAYIVAQYYNIRKYGILGYTAKVNELFRLKDIIESELRKISFLSIISVDHSARLPVICWTYDEEYMFEIITKRFEEFGWVVPYCHISRGKSSRCCRIVIRHNFRKEDAIKLVGDIEAVHRL